MRAEHLTIIISLFIVSCYKWHPNWKDTKFRNQFVGKWRIDSVKFFLPSIRPINDTFEIVDTQYTIYAKSGDYLEILFTKDQVEKNVTCHGKFLDSNLSYEVQGFADKGAEMLSFTYCPTCPASLIFQTHIMGSRYIKGHEGINLKIGTRFWVNGDPNRFFFKDTYLTKID